MVSALKIQTINSKAPECNKLIVILLDRRRRTERGVTFLAPNIMKGDRAGVEDMVGDGGGGGQGRGWGQSGDGVGGQGGDWMGAEGQGMGQKHEQRHEWGRSRGTGLGQIGGDWGIRWGGAGWAP